MVDFAAPAWCVPCRRFAPVFEEAAKRYDDIVFIEVDIDNAQWAVDDYGVMGVPTVTMFVDGKSTKNLPTMGAVPFMKGLEE